jgi:hypothetical protein
MGFEEIWKEFSTHKGVEMVDHLIDRTDAEKIWDVAYRAGLLHAAEQDKKTANEFDMSESTSFAYKNSAAMHEQVAEELK